MKRYGLSVMTYVMAVGACLGCNDSIQFNEARRTLSLDSTLPTAPSESRDARPGLIEKTFDVSRLKSRSLSRSYQYETEVWEQEFKLVRKGATTATFRQLKLDPWMDAFQQMSDTEAGEESFPARDFPLLDVLFLIDNSGSMKPFHDRIGPRLERILSGLSHTDWQIGVVSTEDDEGACLRGPGKVLTKADFEADPTTTKESFRIAIDAGTNGPTIERGIFYAAQALIGDCGDPTRRWVRPHANVAVVFVTDEENCGSTPKENCKGQPGETPDYFFSIAPPGTKAYGMLYDRTRYRPLCTYGGPPSEYRDPLQYQQIIKATGGIYRNICEDRYDEILDELSSSIGAVARTQYVLRDDPVAGSVEVLVDGKPVKDGFAVKGRVIDVSGLDLDEAQTVLIRYRHLTAPLKTSFPLSRRPNAETIKVYVDDERVTGDAYLWHDELNEIVFYEAPREGSRIKIVYKEPQIFPRSFRLAEPVVADSIRVWINGLPNEDFGLDEKTGELVFDEAPPEGAEIRVRYQKPGDVVTAYAFPSVPGRPMQSFGVFDLATSESVAAELREGIIWLDPREVVNGRMVVARATLTPIETHYEIGLSEEPIAESVVLSGNDEARDCLETATIEGTRLSFRCQPNWLSQISVNYDYLIDPVTQFVVRHDFGERAAYEVLVDGIVVEPRAVDGALFSLSEEQVASARVVTIRVWQGD